MDFNFPFLDVLVLPIGATSGERIEINGTLGYIAIYDSADALVALISTDGVMVLDGLFSGTLPNISPNGEMAQMQSGSGLILFRDDVFADQSGGFIQASKTTFAGDDVDRLLITAPKRAALPAGTRSEIRLEHRDDGSANGIRSAILKQNEAYIESTTVGIRAILRSMVPPFSSAANSAAHADLVVTDMVLTNVPVIVGHTYRFWLHTQYAISAVLSTWIFTLNVNGVVTERFHAINNQVASAKTDFVNAFVDWVAPATAITDDFAVGVDETTATAATLTLNAAAGVTRTFSVEDLGIRVA